MSDQMTESQGPWAVEGPAYDGDLWRVAPQVGPVISVCSEREANAVCDALNALEVK